MSKTRGKKPDGSMVFHVSASEAGSTLFGALRRWFSDESPAHVRGLLSQHRVQIDGNLCQDQRRRLKQGEVVKVLPHFIAAPPEERDIRIQYLDDQIVVVEKPAGMTTMHHAEEERWSARRKQRQPTLDELLPRVLARQLGSELRSPTRPASRRGTPRKASSDASRVRLIPVHRLDRDTSGLMVFARTTAAEKSLAEQFRAHSIDRSYLAIVHGDVVEQTIESQLVRDRGDGKRGSTSNPDEGQHAVTHVRPMEQLSGYTLIECRLETGRTHQIRIHLAENGHPLCGDKEYRGSLNQRPIPDCSGAPRLALHAAELGFAHPVTGESLQFQTRLPRDLAAFLRRLRKAGLGN